MMSARPGFSLITLRFLHFNGFGGVKQPLKAGSKGNHGSADRSQIILLRCNISVLSGKFDLRSMVGEDFLKLVVDRKSHAGLYHGHRRRTSRRTEDCSLNPVAGISGESRNGRTSAVWQLKPRKRNVDGVVLAGSS
jgi:hypothetical protein